MMINIRRLRIKNEKYGNTNSLCEQTLTVNMHWHASTWFIFLMYVHLLNVQMFTSFFMLLPLFQIMSRHCFLLLDKKFKFK